MNWKTKARLQRTLSALPAGHRLNFLMQRYVTRSLPRSTGWLEGVVSTAERHLATVSEHLGSGVDTLRFFEFGAGYDLAEPIVSASMGVTDRVLFDIRPVARLSVIRETIDRLGEMGLDLPESGSVESMDDLRAVFGLRYVAPGDARATGLPTGSIDAATSTSVLEHVPEADICAILRELRRILRPGGVCSFAIDYHDHFAGSDPTIDGLHFLRYSDQEWSHWNCDLQYQNRLRHDDYVALFSGAGFELTSIEPVIDPSFPSDPVLAERYIGRTDLSYGDGWFVLTNPAA